MKTILAIDPGSAKCGVAVVQGDSKRTEILLRKVVEIDKLQQDLQLMNDEFQPNLIVIGGGTNSRKTQALIREALPGRALLIVDERDTSVRARERYWQETPRRWWRRLVPSTLQVPPVPVDDLVAVILAEQALSVE